MQLLELLESSWVHQVQLGSRSGMGQPVGSKVFSKAILSHPGPAHPHLAATRDIFCPDDGKSSEAQSIPSEALAWEQAPGK